jgi:hypothetical protein
MRSEFDIMLGDRVVSSFLAQGIVAEQGTRRTYGSADPSPHATAMHAGVVPMIENGLLTEMVTDRDKVGDVTSAAAP